MHTEIIIIYVFLSSQLNDYITPRSAFFHINFIPSSCYETTHLKIKERFFQQPEGRFL